MRSLKEQIVEFCPGVRTLFLGNILLTYVIFQVVVRAILIIYSKNSVSLNLFELIKTFSFGLFYDIVVGLQALIPLFILFLLVPVKFLNNKSSSYLLGSLIFIIYFVMLFVGISQYLFWDEFQVNFNFIAVDYLIYTTEVLGNIKESYNLWLIIPGLCLMAGLLTYIQMKRITKDFLPLQLKEKAFGLIVACLLPVLFFNTVDNKWRSLVSDNQYNVEIAGNGPYEFVSAFRNNELDYAQFYLTEDNLTALQTLRDLLATKEANFLDNRSANRHIEAYRPYIKPNIVMVVVESLSTDFMGSFGNKENLTPNLDRLAEQSLFFTNLYATGTRTVRGLEALALAIPPTPGQSIVRRPENQDMSLLGSVLEQEGYTSLFLYGGYGYFDNMNAFFAGNGYAVTDRTDIAKDKISFETVWGVADEIIFDQALDEMDERTAKQEKVFQMIVTTSNHRPFTYPDGRIDIPTGSREGAVKYTDWAIGDFIEKAKTKAWFSDTIFIIVADHQASSAGHVDLPVNRYHIPCLVYAPHIIEPGKNERLMSQIDIPPTLLGLMGHSYDSKFLGYDINTLDAGQERAFVSTYQNLGYIKDGKIVILKPQNKVEMYKIKNFAASDYEKIDNDEKLIKEAVAWYQGASYLYKNKMLTNDKKNQDTNLQVASGGENENFIGRR